MQADNPGAGDAEWVARDRLAHELMYFSRGNPVVYYGDEQGFTGPGGDQDARQTMFASRVPEYLDDDLLGTDATHATSNFVPGHPLYRSINQLAELTQRHPALRDGAHQHRYGSDTAGVYAFSRLDRGQQREYVVALNNSEQASTATIPTYGRNTFVKIYGDGERAVRTARNGDLTLTVPPLSAVVYQATDRLDRSRTAPSISLAQPQPAAGANSRAHRGRAPTARRRSRSPIRRRRRRRTVGWRSARTSAARRSTRSRSRRRSAAAGGARSAPTTPRRTRCSTTCPASRRA